MTAPPPVFAVLDTGLTIDGDGREWPTAVIDASAEPAVSDLARVHAVEGIGDIATEAAVVATDPNDEATPGVDHLLILSVIVTVPVRCAFAVVFSLPLQRQVLDDAARSKQLVIATTNPHEAAADEPLWLAIDLDDRLLSDVLPGG